MDIGIRIAEAHWFVDAFSDNGEDFSNRVWKKMTMPMVMIISKEAQLQARQKLIMIAMIFRKKGNVGLINNNRQIIIANYGW